METTPHTASDKVLEVRTRLEDEARAREIAAVLVEDGLAACAHVRGPLYSVYLWQGEVRNAAEYELDAVTSTAKLELLVARVVALHPYDTPAVLVTTARATTRYAAWVQASTET